jgi:hypothetical protein
MTSTKPPRIPQINVICVVDVISTLKSGQLQGNLHMMDNSDQPLTFGQGTGRLCSAVWFEQVINWHVIPVDFQTDIRISQITFTYWEQPPCLKLKRYGAPSGEYWAGIVNRPSEISRGLYYYRIEFDMGGRRITTDRFPSIFVME